MQWKSLVSQRLDALDLESLLPGWSVEVREGDSGQPAVVVDSPELPDGRHLRGHIQAAGQGVSDPLAVEYFLGVSVPLDEENFPEPSEAETAPEWMAHLRRLHDQVLDGRVEELLVSTHRPGTSRKELGERKLPLAEKFLPDDQMWLAKGYADGWALGIRSKKRELDRVEELAGPFVEILTTWWGIENP